MTRIIGISFDHMHMGDLLRQVHDHPAAEIAGIYDPDPARMTAAAETFAIPASRVFTDLEACLGQGADIAILCAATADHAAFTERLAGRVRAILVEKPFAASLSEADRMIAACDRAGTTLAINWPLAWYPSHRITKRLIDDGAIGPVTELHFHDGNRGPLWHLADKVEVSAAEVARQKPHSWWYKAAAGGGSLRDYLGYGATLGTWFLNGEAPLDVTAATWAAPGLEVDEHSITILRYARGMSKMETRWGTLTDPWTIQPQPRCGFVVVGEDGSISSWDYDPHVTLQTRAHPAPRVIPADSFAAPHRAPVEHLIHVLQGGGPLHGPLTLAIGRTGQRIVDTAAASARAGRTLPLLG